MTDILRSGVMDRIITGASVLGNLVLGALAAQFVAIYIAVPIRVGATNINIQTDILDRIFPGLLGLGLVLLDVVAPAPRHQPGHAARSRTW